MKRCLDENETAQFAEYIAGFDQPRLNEDVLLHIRDCPDCKLIILEISELIEEFDLPLRKLRTKTMCRFIIAILIVGSLIGCTKEVVEPENVALNKPASASGDTNEAFPRFAVDGNPDSGWVSLNPPQWISISLQGDYAVSKVRLLVNQAPNGYTEHVVNLMSKGQVIHVIDIKEETYKWQWIEREFNEVADIDEIRVQTNKSPSWVAWNEIEVYGVLLD